MKILAKYNLKNKKGITLIALVITIIVLLILAGVTVATLTGENGLLGKAQNAKEQTTIAQYKERIDLVKAEVSADAKAEPVTLEKLKTAFSDAKQSDWVNKVEDTDGNTEIKLTTNDGYIFFVAVNATRYAGQGEVELPETIAASDITFTPSSENSGWKKADGSDIKTVADALDSLYGN